MDAVLEMYAVKESRELIRLASALEDTATADRDLENHKSTEKLVFSARDGDGDKEEQDAYSRRISAIQDSSTRNGGNSLQS